MTRRFATKPAVFLRWSPPALIKQCPPPSLRAFASPHSYFLSCLFHSTSPRCSLVPVVCQLGSLVTLLCWHRLCQAKHQLDLLCSCNPPPLPTHTLSSFLSFWAAVHFLLTAPPQCLFLLSSSPTLFFHLPPPPTFTFPVSSAALLFHYLTLHFFPLDLISTSFTLLSSHSPDFLAVLVSLDSPPSPRPLFPLPPVILWAKVWCF